MSNVSDVLKQLDNLSVEGGIQVFVPSLQKNILFKPLNLRQQKDLLRTTIDESLIKLAFNNLLADLIKENALEPIDINNLFPFDRTVIAIALRAKGLDSDYTINNQTVSLTDKLEEIKAISLSSAKLTTAITEGPVTIDVAVPRLSVDREINSYALTKTKSLQENDIKTIISDLVVYEFTKFIQSIVIKTAEKQETTHLNTLKPVDRVSIVEKLPSTVTNKIFDFVKSYRSFENKFTQVGEDNIDIDGNFFTV
jgi:hypothetical protein